MSGSPPKRIIVTQRSRPLRFGYLLRGLEDEDGMRSGIRLYTTLWGGVYNCFIPVYDDPPSWWSGARSAEEISVGYLEAFEPDYLVTEDPGLAEGLEWDEDRILSKSALVRQDPHSPFSYGIGVHELFHSMWENEFKYVRRRPSEIVKPVAVEREYESMVATCFGDFSRVASERPDFESAFRSVFGATDLTLTPDQMLRLYLDGIDSPFTLGKTHLKCRRRGWTWDPLLYLLDPTSTLDLVDFWNLRALGWNPIPVPRPWFDDLKSRLAPLVADAYRRHPHNASLMIRTTLLQGRSLDEAVATACAAELRAACPDGLISIRYPRIWDRFGRAHDHALRAKVVASSAESEVSVAGGRITFRACPLPFEPSFSPYRRADSARVIRLRDYLGGSDVASVTPPDLALAKSVVGAMPLEDVWFTSKGIVTTCARDNCRFLWHLPRGIDVCGAWLTQHGFSFTVTSGGRLMHEAVRALGGLNCTWIVAKEELVELLNGMAGLPDRPRDTYNNPKMIGKLKRITGHERRARNLLRTLLECRVLEVGVQLKCEQCIQRNWYALDAIKKRLRCHRCLQEYPFPAAHPPDEPWHYRSVGPFAVEDYIQGGLSVMLSLGFLRRLSAGSRRRITWCPSFELENDSGKCEVDAMAFVAQSDPYSGAVVPMFVEGKSYGAEDRIFGEKDVRVMRRVGEHFPGAVLVFATFNSELTPADKELIGPMAEMGREPISDGHWKNPVVILTGNELFSEIGAPKSLHELADDTQQRYLEMEPHADYVARWLQ